MLHFDHDAARPPHLVVHDGGRSDAPATAVGHPQLAALLVVAATLVAVLIDLVDTTPRWSPFAVLVSVAVLGVHALLRRR